MKITSILRQKKNPNRYSVFIDYKYSFGISDETLLKSGLKDGMELSQADIDRISGDEQNSKAFESALNLLEYRSRSKKELRDKLARKKLSPDVIDKALERVERIGYLNDGQFAREFAQGLIAKGKGPILIRTELIRKGIDRETIDDIMSGIKETSESLIENAKALVEKKLKQLKGKEPDVIARRLTGFLARRGFSPDSIRTILKGAKKDIISEE